MAVGRFGLDKVKFDVLLYIKRFGVKKLIVWIKEPLNRERGLPRCLNPNPSGDKELVKKPPKSASTQVSNNFRPFMSFNPILFYEGVYNGLTPAEHLHI